MAEQKQRKLLNKIFLFILIGLVPGLFLYTFSKGKQMFHAPQYFGALVDDNGDTTYHKVPNFKMTTIGNKTIELDDYKDKFIVVAVIGKSCPDDCEVHVDGFLQILMDKINGNNKFDDVVVMTEFVNYDSRSKPSFDLIDPVFSKNYDLDNWIFFHTDQNEFYNFSAVTNMPNLLKTTLAGSRNGKAYYNFALLLDKDRHIRGIHNIKSSSDHVRNILDDIKVLKKMEDNAKH